MRYGGAPEPTFDINSDLKKLADVYEQATNISEYYNKPADQRQDARNRFIAGRLVQMDLRYLEFIKTMTADKQNLDSATDIANLTLSLAGTLVGSVRAKTNLAAAAAGVGGTKATIDKNYYYEKSIDALVATMNAKRKEVLVQILGGLSASLTQYPFERALTDLHQYFLAGTLNGALQFINSQAVQSETASDKEIKVHYRLAVPTAVHVVDTERLTDAVGSKDLTVAAANIALTALGVTKADLATSLDDAGGKAGARRKLQDEVKKAYHVADDKERTAALKKITDAFTAAGLLKP